MKPIKTTSAWIIYPIFGRKQLRLAAIAILATSSVAWFARASDRLGTAAWKIAALPAVAEDTETLLKAIESDDAQVRQRAEDKLKERHRALVERLIDIAKRNEASDAKGLPKVAPPSRVAAYALAEMNARSAIPLYLKNITHTIPGDPRSSSSRLLFHFHPYAQGLVTMRGQAIPEILLYLESRAPSAIDDYELEFIAKIHFHCYDVHTQGGGFGAARALRGRLPSMSQGEQNLQRALDWTERELKRKYPNGTPADIPGEVDRSPCPQRSSRCSMKTPPNRGQ